MGDRCSRARTSGRSRCGTPRARRGGGGSSGPRNGTLGYAPSKLPKRAHRANVMLPRRGSSPLHRSRPRRALDAVEAAGLVPPGTARCCVASRTASGICASTTRRTSSSSSTGRRWSRTGIEDEHRFLLDLRDAEIPVCAPLALPGGGTVGEHAASISASGRAPAAASPTS